MSARKQVSTTKNTQKQGGPPHEDNTLENE